VYSIPSAVVKCAFKGHTRGINAVCVTPDGQRVVTASNDNTAKVWDMSTGACTLTLFVGAIVTAAAVSAQVGR
jgi:glucose repression regulatory protein TUP1